MDCVQEALVRLVKTPDLDECVHQVKVFPETGALHLDGVSPEVRDTVSMLQKVLAANRQWSEAASLDDLHEVVQTLDPSGCFGENRTTGTLKLFPNGRCLLPGASEVKHRVGVVEGICSTLCGAFEGISNVALGEKP